MPKFKITWIKHAYSYVDAKTPEEALAKAEKGEDYDFEDPEDTYGSDTCGWVADDAEEEDD